MSSSNIHSTVNFTSSSNVTSPPLPSVFELLAQERLTELLRPCLRQILKFLHETHPCSKSLNIVFKYKNEFILLIETIVQWLYLHSYSALVSEKFYGLKRTANHHLRSVIFSVFLPYVRIKLDSLHEQMLINNDHRHAQFYMLLKILPKIEIFIEGICWLYRLGYAFGRAEYYSPSLQLAGVKLIYTKEPSRTTPLTTAGRFFSIISQIISSGLFLIQFIDWWNNINSTKKHSGHANINPPLPTTLPTRMTIGKRQCPLCRQPCRIPTAVLGSGYVYCHTCISDYVNRHHRCPTTNQPVTSEQLIKIY